MELEAIVRTAWNTTRREHQPEYDALEGSYQSYLCKRAEPILATNYPTGDGALADFDHWLADYHRRQEEAQNRGETVDQSSDKAPGSTTPRPRRTARKKDSSG